MLWLTMPLHINTGWPQPIPKKLSLALWLQCLNIARSESLGTRQVVPRSSGEFSPAIRDTKFWQDTWRCVLHSCKQNLLASVKMNNVKSTTWSIRMLKSILTTALKWLPITSSATSCPYDAGEWQRGQFLKDLWNTSKCGRLAGAALRLCRQGTWSHSWGRRWSWGKVLIPLWEII